MQTPNIIVYSVSNASIELQENLVCSILEPTVSDGNGEKF